MKSNKFSKFLIFAMTVAILLFSLLFFINKNQNLRHKISPIPQNFTGLLSHVVRWPYEWSNEVIEQYQSLLNTYRENAELKKSLSLIENQETLIADLEKENETLRQQLGIEEAFKPSISIQTKLLSRSTVSWLDFAYVDKGEKSGVEEKMLLLSTDGVLGIVSQVTPFSSQIELLTNTERQESLAVKMTIEGETVYGVLSGYDVQKGAAIITQVNRLLDIPSGIQVLTSGLDGFGQENLPVGKVQSIEKDKNQSLTVYVTLAADLENGDGLVLVGR